MAHEIDQTTGQAAVFVTGEPAWHKLGTVIERAASSVEAIGLAGLDWTVEQWPVRAFDPDHPQQEAAATNVVANVRTDTRSVLGVVSRRYRVFQNREAFNFMDALVGDKLAMYETAGSLHGGRRVWMLARIPKEYRAGSDDLIKPYVLLTNTHDGSQALRMIPTTIRVVCQNTLNLALGEAGVDGLTISHHPRLDSRVHEARTKLGIIAARFDKFDAELHAMLDADVTVPQAATYFGTLAGTHLPTTSERQKNAREKVYGQMLANFDNDRNTLPGVKHTAWAAYNAVSEWADHQRPYRGGNATEKLNRRLDAEATTPLFRTAYRRTGRFTSAPLTADDARRMIKRRIKAAGLSSRLSPHSFRVCTITDLLTQGTPLEDVQYLAGHCDPRTTRIYDRRQKKVTRNIVERISV